MDEVTSLNTWIEPTLLELAYVVIQLRGLYILQSSQSSLGLSWGQVFVCRQEGSILQFSSINFLFQDLSSLHDIYSCSLLMPFLVLSLILLLPYSCVNVSFNLLFYLFSNGFVKKPSFTSRHILNY